MNSKQRVAAALKRQVPDKVPYGEFAIDFDTVERVLGHKTLYRNKAGAQKAVWEGRWDELAESVVRDSVAIAEAIDQDVIPGPILPARTAVRPKKIDDETYEYADGRVLKYSAATNDFTIVHWPEIDYLPTDEDIEEAAKGQVFEEYRLVAIKRLVERFGKEKFIVSGGPAETGMPLFGGMENGLMYYLTDPGRIKAYLEAATIGGAKTDKYYMSLGLDAVMWGTDYAYNAGPFMSPAMFREFVVPYTTRRVKAIHALGLPVIQHACGNNWALMDFFVEMGLDCYQSIQNSAGMDIRLLKEQYGARIALWGGAGVEKLVSGTPDDVARDVEYAMRWGKPGGGYIFGTSHSVAVGTRYENYMRMLEEFHRRRDY
jgi:uroporphyrinogen-III decarboxylase